MPAFIVAALALIGELIVYVLDLVLRRLVFMVIRLLVGEVPFLSEFKAARAVYQAYERHESVRWLAKRLGQQVTITQRLTYYRGVLRHTTEFRNVWSRGVIGGFVNVNFVGKQPPVHHGTARVSLVLNGRKVPIKPRKPRSSPPNVHGGARFRSRLKRSGLGV